MIAFVMFYGNMEKAMRLEDCSIIYFGITEFVPELDKNKISIQLNGIDLLSKLETDEMKKTFGEGFFGSKIIREHEIETEKHYNISWDSQSNHLLFSSYHAIIDMDDNYFMKTIQFICEIAREPDQ